MNTIMTIMFYSLGALLLLGCFLFILCWIIIEFVKEIINKD